MNWLFGKKKNINSKFKSRTPMTRKQKLLKLSQSDTFYSVVITRCGCEASSKLIGKCFLFEETPSLPLQGCTATRCTCEYQGVVNRRRGERRVAERRASIRMNDDRRKAGRRKGDGLWNKYDV